MPDFLTGEAIQRVFRCKFECGEGTIFAINVRNRQYLVTAKHVLRPSYVEGIDLKIFHGNTWRNIYTRLIGHSRNNDISVLTANECLVPKDLECEASSGGLTFGQEVFFLGFPNGYFGRYPDNEYPLPFVKHGIVSSLPNDEGVFHIDGLANPGFSGGPVLFRHHQSGRWKIAGVLSGNLAETESICTSDGTEIDRHRDSGLIQIESISEAIRVIESNPTGFELI